MFGLSAIATKVIFFVVLGASISGAGIAFVIHQRHVGRDAAIAQMTKETGAESVRRRAVVEEAMKVAEAAAVKLQIAEAHRDALLRQIDTLSARNDGNPCIDIDGVRRLRELDGR